MNLYLDDNLANKVLVTLLRRAGHRGALPSDLGMAGASDPRHLTAAVRNQFVLLTKNHKDFAELHDLVQATAGRHGGILLVRSDNDPTRDMKDRDIVRALGNLERSGVPIANELHVLNHWR